MLDKLLARLAGRRSAAGVKDTAKPRAVHRLFTEQRWRHSCGPASDSREFVF
eukprot:COSAG06_NODE_31901_length_514_cov_0.872289_1_plen_51_part_01